MDARELAATEAAVARVSARRATRSVLVFVAWGLLTWLGPDLLPNEGWSLLESAVALVAYGLLTVLALVAVHHGAIRLVRARAMRRAVGAHLAPFWTVLLAAACAAAFTFTAIDDQVTAAWVSVGVLLATLSAAHAIARHLEVRALRAQERHLSHAPSDLALATWRKELVARLEAAASIQLPHADRRAFAAEPPLAPRGSATRRGRAR